MVVSGTISPTSKVQEEEQGSKEVEASATLVLFLLAQH